MAQTAPRAGSALRMTAPYGAAFASMDIHTTGRTQDGIWALDVTVQAEIADLMKDLCAQQGTAILMISHDLALVTDICARVCVMYAGRIVESQASGAVFRTPAHPYTKGLVGSLPRLGMRARHGQRKLAEIVGTVPSVANLPPGCRFHPRCSGMTEICATTEPAATQLADGGLVRCHHV